MKKVYKNKLPKNTEVLNIFSRVENGKIVVEVNLKETFQPKFGDIVRIVASHKQEENRSYMICIWPENFKNLDKYQQNCFNIANIDYAGKLSYNCGNGQKYGQELEVIPASKEDIKELFDKLAKKGKKWNAKKKCLEDIPKFGDIVRIEHPDCSLYERDYVIGIFPNKKTPDKDENAFFDIAFIDMKGRLSTDRAALYSYGHVYFATEEEKQELFNKLKEAGKQWNPDTKQLENLRWVPAEGETFYFVNWNGKVYQDQNYGTSSKLKVSAGNCFKTEEAAKPYADQIKQILKNSKAY